ncbi:MAG: ABC transporter ATP-binding protein, partial [Rhizobiales bacterium]|nr:ABC transporter ATP-binding protein [Hyphomicrobiales bacterium]
MAKKSSDKSVSKASGDDREVPPSDVDPAKSVRAPEKDPTSGKSGKGHDPDDEDDDDLDDEIDLDDDDDEELVVYTASEAAGALATIYGFVRPHFGN